MLKGLPTALAQVKAGNTSENIRQICLFFHINIIKTDELYYNSKLRKRYNFNEYSLPFVFLRDIHERYLSLKMWMMSKASLLIN